MVNTISGADRYDYDANGNVTVRNKGLSTQQGLTWSDENRLVSVTGSGANLPEWSLYDPDGQRVKKINNSTIATYYPFPHYEVENGTVVKYYFFNGQRVAMRRGGTLYYLHGDHLGSTHFVTKSNGTEQSNQSYYAYGRTRLFFGSTPSDHKFTGQKLDAATGLYYYNARYYDPVIGSFLSPDTLVPDPTLVWDYNRFGYVRGNPLKYTDPSGHVVETVWDAANIAWGAASLVNNVREGNWGDAAWDAGGLIVDGAATITPFIPGGAAAILRAGRAADKLLDAARATNRVLDSGVAAYRTYRGSGIHPASTGKAFSDWFKGNILKNPNAKGRQILDGARIADIVDDAGTLVDNGAKQIYELKNYTPQTSISSKFWAQASDYIDYADDFEYTMNYVFGEKIGDAVAQRLRGMGIKTWYIDDAGEMVEWVTD
jgi:RHS repeat-associated protein